ncbi:phosphotransferase [Roseobacteraceae bacterium S113]
MDLSETATLRAWPGLAAQAGLDPQMRARPLKRDGSVVRFGECVAKHVPSGFAAALRAHRQAARVMIGDRRNRMPRVLAWDAARAVILLEFAPGRTLRERLLAGEDPVGLCARVGRWLGAYHSARPGDLVPFETRGPLRRVPEEAPYMAQAYVRERATLAGMAEKLDGQPVARAVLHGDLHAGNLMIAGDVVTGLDVENTALHPAMRDAGQILAQMHLLADPGPDVFWPDDWRAAFEEAYGEGGDVLAFFLRQRLMQVWAMVPERASDRGAQRGMQAEALSRMFG